MLTTRTRQWKIQNSISVSDAGTLFFFFVADFKSAQNMVRIIKGKFKKSDLRGNKNYFELAGGSSYWGEVDFGSS